MERRAGRPADEVAAVCDALHSPEVAEMVAMKYDTVAEGFETIALERGFEHAFEHVWRGVRLNWRVQAEMVQFLCEKRTLDNAQDVHRILLHTRSAIHRFAVFLLANVLRRESPVETQQIIDRFCPLPYYDEATLFLYHTVNVANLLTNAATYPEGREMCVTHVQDAATHAGSDQM